MLKLLDVPHLRHDGGPKGLPDARDSGQRAVERLKELVDLLIQCLDLPLQVLDLVYNLFDLEAEASPPS